MPNPEPLTLPIGVIDPGADQRLVGRARPPRGVLADEVGSDYDLVLAITRGGLVPAGILAYRLDLREILVAGVEFYTTGGLTHDAPIFGHFPDAELLRGRRVLVVDEVWETGETMAAVFDRVLAAGGHPVSAVDPLQAGPVAGRPGARLPRRAGPRLGDLPVQGRRLIATSAGRPPVLAAAARARGTAWCARASRHPAPVGAQCARCHRVNRLADRRWPARSPGRPRPAPRAAAPAAAPGHVPAPGRRPPGPDQRHEHPGPGLRAGRRRAPRGCGLLRERIAGGLAGRLGQSRGRRRSPPPAARRGRPRARPAAAPATPARPDRPARRRRPARRLPVPRSCRWRSSPTWTTFAKG